MRSQYKYAVAALFGFHAVLCSSRPTRSTARSALLRTRVLESKGPTAAKQLDCNATDAKGAGCGIIKRPAANVTVDLVIRNNTLYPDGYAFIGNFFDEGRSYLGPLIEAMEGDMILATVTNKGSVSQATHWHGLDAKGYPFNDGAVGYSMGAMPAGTSYLYKFVASPAGTSWYHGHMEEVLMGGNRGPVIVRKANDPHRHLYDGGEVVVVLSESMPWLLDETKTRVVRHMTAEEDRESFFMGTYFEYDGIVTDAGQGPASEMPWAGMLVNGVGRAVPLNYSSEPKTGKSQPWGEPKGQYFQLNVTHGKTQRLRLLNAGGAWSVRVWIEDHPMQVISVSGTDIEPVKVEGPYGLEISPAERYDVLVAWDKAPGSVHRMRIESTDGCYKTAAFVVYEGGVVTPAMIKQADDLQRNRTCDADCYSEKGCDYYKSFALDTNHTHLHSIETTAVPPPNPSNKTGAIVVHEPRTPLFDVNGLAAPALNPPVYKQMMDAGFRLGNLKDKNVSSFLTQYSFRTNETVDWCVVSYTVDRHPIHLHANRFWVLATGAGDVHDCFAAQVDTTKPLVRSDMLVMRYAAEDKPQWVKFRAQLMQRGAFPLHCHLQYHIYKALGVPVVVGADELWPTPPADLPSGGYNGTGDGSSDVISENGGK